MAQDEVSGAGATASKQPSLDFGQVECPVCLQPSIHPVKLHCGHIFCFLCVKGVAIQSKRCPMCRQEIAENYLDDPDLLFPLDATALRTDENSYVWYYEGRRGWWMYDERTTTELENSFKAGKQEVELLIAGSLYKINLQDMVQCRRNEPNRRRAIKRELAVTQVPKKGIAGLRIQGLLGSEESPLRSISPQLVADPGRPASVASDLARALSRLRVDNNSGDNDRTVSETSGEGSSSSALFRDGIRRRHRSQ